MSSQSVQVQIKELRSARGLFKPDWSKRIAAAQTLGAQRTGDAVGDLGAVIQENQNADLSRAAIQALGQIGTPEAVTALIAVLGKPDAEQRELAAKALVGLGPENAARPLLRAMADPSPALSAAAHSVLLRFGELTPLLIAALADSDSRISSAARKRLGELGNAVIPALIAALADPSPAVRDGANDLLKQLGDVPSLLVTALGDRDERVRDIARQELGKGDKAVIPALIVGLAAPSPGVSDGADELLRHFGDVTALLVASFADGDDRVLEAARQRLLESRQEAIPALVEGVAGSNPKIQCQASALLAQVGALAVPAIVAAMPQADDPARARLVKTLGEIGQPAVPDLVNLLGDSAPLVSQAAAEALGRIGQPACKPLIMAIAGEDGRAARTAVDAIIRLGEPAVPELIALLGHEDGKVRKLAAGALRKIDCAEVQALWPALAGWGEAETPPKAILVDPAGSGDYRTLAEAVAVAPEHALIRLSPGIHRLAEPLLIQKAITLLGEDVDKCQVLCAGEEYVVRFSGAGSFSAKNLTFEHEGELWGSVLEASAGTLQLARCRFQGGVFKEAYRASNSKRVFDLFDRVMSKEQVTSADVTSAEKLILDGDDENLRSHIFMLGDRELAINVSNSRHLRLGSGIYLEGDVRATVTNCLLIANECDGIAVEDRAQATLHGNMCIHNKNSGILFGGSLKGDARENHCCDNGAKGIVAYRSAEVWLERNICEKNLSAGIAFWDTSAGTALHNRCQGGEVQEQGILVGDQAKPSLEGNICDNNKGDGIEVGAQSAPMLIGNTCDGNARAGIVFIHQASGKADKNRCSENGLAGIVVLAEASPQLERNVCEVNKRIGIAFLGASEGCARENECRRNVTGIYVGESAHPTLEKNLCERNQSNGITFDNAAGGVASQNRSIGNGANGIEVDASASPTLSGNNCRENAKCGILFLDQSSGTVEGNTCSTNTYGIVVQPTARPRVGNNACSGNRQQDVMRG